jgi:hypothetical protein
VLYIKKFVYYYYESVLFIAYEAVH